MSHTHKLVIYSTRDEWKTRYWYTFCKCGWEAETRHVWPDGASRWARPTWDAALAIGVAHQRNVDLNERLWG